jgi:hypothetical protein
VDHRDVDIPRWDLGRFLGFKAFEDFLGSGVAGTGADCPDRVAGIGLFEEGAKVLVDVIYHILVASSRDGQHFSLHRDSCEHECKRCVGQFSHEHFSMFQVESVGVISPSAANGGQ